MATLPTAEERIKAQFGPHLSAQIAEGSAAVEPLTPPYWINMGALAITTLAGARLLIALGPLHFAVDLKPFIAGFTLFFWSLPVRDCRTGRLGDHLYRSLSPMSQRSFQNPTLVC
jgi:hypothetical protein